MVIYRDDNAEAARTIWLSLQDDRVNMTEQDVGPLVERLRGRNASERFLSRINVEEVKRILGVTTDSEMMDTLAEMFGRNSGFDDFAYFLKQHELEFEAGFY